MFDEKKLITVGDHTREKFQMKATFPWKQWKNKKFSEAWRQRHRGSLIGGPTDLPHLPFIPCEHIQRSELHHHLSKPLREHRMVCCHLLNNGLSSLIFNQMRIGNQQRSPPVHHILEEEVIKNSWSGIKVHWGVPILGCAIAGTCLVDFIKHLCTEGGIRLPSCIEVRGPLHEEVTVSDANWMCAQQHHHFFYVEPFSAEEFHHLVHGPGWQRKIVGFYNACEGKKRVSTTTEGPLSR